MSEDTSMNEQSKNADKSPIRLRREWEDQLLYWRTVIFLGVNSFLLPKIVDLQKTERSLIFLGTLAVLNVFWILCSYQSYRSIKRLTIKCGNDAGQRIVNEALGKRSLCQAFRPSTIVCIYVPAFMFGIITFLWLYQVIPSMPLWIALKYLVHTTWFVLLPILICIFILLVLSIARIDKE
jgi:hypothetical protein